MLTRNFFIPIYLMFISFLFQSNWIVYKQRLIRNIDNFTWRNIAIDQYPKYDTFVITVIMSRTYCSKQYWVDQLPTSFYLYFFNPFGTQNFVDNWKTIFLWHCDKYIEWIRPKTIFYLLFSFQIIFHHQIIFYRIKTIIPHE